MCASNDTIICERYTVDMDDVLKRIVDLANNDGGEIRIDLSDDGTVVGVEQAAETQKQLLHMIRSGIAPDIIPQVLCEADDSDGKTVLVIQVHPDSQGPYALISSSDLAERDHVEPTVKQDNRTTGEEPYEMQRSPLQNLTFRYAEKLFRDKKMKFKTKKKKAYGLVRPDGSFSNLGLLLSDQCTHTIKVAVFSGTDKTFLQTQTEFAGSVIKQFTDVYAYLNRQKTPGSTGSESKQADVSDYPDGSIRETLLNAVVHRDYSFSDSTIISVFSDRMSFVSLGGLPKGLVRNDLELGASVIRNKRLSDVFSRLHLIEACGTGLSRLRTQYRPTGLQPAIEVSEQVFRLTLPNTSYIAQHDSDQLLLLSPDEQRIAGYLSANSPTMRKAIEEAFGFSQAKTIRLLNSLITKNVAVKSGQGKGTTYARTTFADGAV